MRSAAKNLWLFLGTRESRYFRMPTNRLELVTLLSLDRDRMKTQIAMTIFGALIVGGTGLFFAQRTPPLTNRSQPLVGFLRSYLSSGAKGPPDTTTRITAVNVPAENGKSQAEIVYLEGPEWCGSGGCTLLILKQVDASFKVLGRVPIVRPPIRILPSANNEFPDIGVQVQGGGIQPGYEAVLSFNGKRYPSNPSLHPARKAKTSEGKVIIATTHDSVSLY